jgi:chromate reductase
VRILVVNGSVRGAHGDCARALDAAARHLGDEEIANVVLAEYRGTVEGMVELIRGADAFVVGTGTYWGNPGSPLLRFLEVITPLEATDAFVGKPVACVVTMDSVGGVDVATRLLGTFAMMGCVVAPFPLVVLSRTGHAVAGQPGFDDVWQEKDLEVTMKNLVAAASSDRSRFVAWPVDKGRLPSGAWPASGVLDLGFPKFSDD